MIVSLVRINESNGRYSAENIANIHPDTCQRVDLDLKHGLDFEGALPEVLDRVRGAYSGVNCHLKYLGSPGLTAMDDVRLATAELERKRELTNLAVQ